MPKLTSGTGRSGFEITPVTPSLDGPRDAYDVTVWHDKVAVFQHQYNVHGWQNGHWNVYRIARAFQHARRLMDVKADFGLYRHLADDPSYNEEVSLHLEVIWLHVVLRGCTYEKKPNFLVQFFLWTNPDRDYAPNAPLSTQLTSFVGDEINVLPKAAVTFGKALESECRKAERLRKKLGLRHFDDF
jgi:hypothetical protein